MSDAPLTCSQLLVKLQQLVEDGHGDELVVVSDDGAEVLWQVTDVECDDFGEGEVVVLL